MNRNQVLNFAVGLISGGVVGAAAVMLLAPQAGDETRQGIVDKINEIIESGKQAAAERKQELEQEYQTRIQIPLPSSPVESA